MCLYLFVNPAVGRQSRRMAGSRLARAMLMSLENKMGIRSKQKAFAGVNGGTLWLLTYSSISFKIRALRHRVQVPPLKKHWSAGEKSLSGTPCLGGEAHLFLPQITHPLRSYGNLECRLCPVTGWENHLPLRAGRS